MSLHGRQQPSATHSPGSDPGVNYWRPSCSQLTGSSNDAEETHTGDEDTDSPHSVQASEVEAPHDWLTTDADWSTA